MSRKNVIIDKLTIIDAAYEIIKNEGLFIFSTRKLAVRLGISKTTAYNYFSNKNEILDLVTDKAIKDFQENIICLIESGIYQINNLLDLLIVVADVTYDFIEDFGDLYKLISRRMAKIHDTESFIEERFRIMYPVYKCINENFKFSDYREFSSQDFLNKHHYISIIINQLALTESCREKKIGKIKFMKSIENAWVLITRGTLPLKNM